MWINRLEYKFYFLNGDCILLLTVTKLHLIFSKDKKNLGACQSKGKKISDDNHLRSRGNQRIKVIHSSSGACSR